MAAQIQFNHYDPFKQARTQPSLSATPPRPKSGAPRVAGTLQPGLSIQYEGSPNRYDDMGWDRNEMPIPRNKPKRDTRGPRDTCMSLGPQLPRGPSRIDSVLDAYADMYAVDEPENGQQYQSTFRPPTQKYGRHAEPWDERGKTGLYGGGGRGADDRETGWVRGYSIGSSTQSAGMEEDLHFDPVDEYRHSSGDEEDGPRSSSETAQSSSYPVTPTSTHFPLNHSRTKSYESPTPSASLALAAPPPAPSRRLSATQSASRTPERPPRTDFSPRDAPLSPADGLLLQRKAPAPVPLTPNSASLPLAKPTSSPLANPSPKHSSPLFKWKGRSKRPPPISNPILPDGFVDSLGMRTFTLTPGCKAPYNAQPISSNTLPAPPAPPAPPVPAPQTPDRPSLPLNYAPGPPRDVSPARRPTPVRSASTSTRRSARPKSTVSTRTSPPRASRDNIHRSSDTLPTEAMARFSIASHASVASDPTGPTASKNPNHRQFFDQMRHGHHQADEAIPSLPLRPPQEPYGGNFQDRDLRRSTSFKTSSNGSTVRGYEPEWNNSPAIASREDERGSMVQYDYRGNEVSQADVDDSVQSDYSEYSADSRRPSSNYAHDLSYYGSSHDYSRNASYEWNGSGTTTDNRYEDLASQLETLDDSHLHFGVEPVKPLNVRRTPPTTPDSTLSRFTPTSPASTAPSSSSASKPAGISEFNRRANKAVNRESSIDPLSAYKGLKNVPVQDGPVIGTTGFRNPFG